MRDYNSYENLKRNALTLAGMPLFIFKGHDFNIHYYNSIIEIK